MKKKIVVWALVLILPAALLAGCGAAKESSAEVNGTYAAMPQQAMAESMEYEYAADTVSFSAGVPAPEIQSTDAKIIYRAELDMETIAFDDTAAAIAGLTDDCGGYFEQSRVSGGSGYRSACYTVRIPAENYRDFLTQAGELGHLLSVYEYTEDVTEAYYDTDGRLATQQAKLSRLQELLTQAEDMEDIITIESAIAETEEQIDRLSGTLRHYDTLVDYATVTLWLDEVYRLSNVEEPVQGFPSRLSAAFGAGWQGFLDGMESLAIALAYGWLWLVLIAVILVICLPICRKARKRRKEKTSEPSE